MLWKIWCSPARGDAQFSRRGFAVIDRAHPASFLPTLRRVLFHRADDARNRTHQTLAQIFGGKDDCTGGDFSCGGVILGFVFVVGSGIVGDSTVVRWEIWHLRRLVFRETSHVCSLEFEAKSPRLKLLPRQRLNSLLGKRQGLILAP